MIGRFQFFQGFSFGFFYINSSKLNDPETHQSEEAKSTCTTNVFYNRETINTTKVLPSQLVKVANDIALLVWPKEIF
jgi:hypothetical protein